MQDFFENSVKNHVSWFLWWLVSSLVSMVWLFMMDLASSSCSVNILPKSLLIYATQSHVQSGHTENFSCGKRLHIPSASCARWHYPIVCMPMLHTAHTFDAILQHCLHADDSGVVPWFYIHDIYCICEVHSDPVCVLRRGMCIQLETLSVLVTIKSVHCPSLA